MANINLSLYYILGRLRQRISRFFQNVQLVSTYLCENGLSNYTARKAKFRNRRNAAPDLRIQISVIKINVKKETKDTKLYIVNLTSIDYVPYKNRK